MALQAVTDQEAGGLDYSKTLDMEKFWGKPTPYPRVPLEKMETKNQEELRLARNREKKQEAKEEYEKAWNHWRNNSASGLNLSAANARATQRQSCL